MRFIDLNVTEERHMKNYACVARFIFDDVIAGDWERDRNIGFTHALVTAFEPLDTDTVRFAPHAFCDEKNMWKAVVSCTIKAERPKTILRTEAAVTSRLNALMPWGLMDAFILEVFKSAVKKRDEVVRKEYLQHLRNEIQKRAIVLSREEVRYRERLDALREDVKREVPRVLQTALAQMKTDSGVPHQDLDDAMVLDPVVQPMLFIG